MYSHRLHRFLVFKFLLIIYFCGMNVLPACISVHRVRSSLRGAQSSGAGVPDGCEPCVHWEQSEARSLARAISPASQGFLFLCLFNVFCILCGEKIFHASACVEAREQLPGADPP